MARQLRLSLEQESLPSFDNFVVGSSNAAAVAAVRAWPNWRGGALAIVGPDGAGKSHLAKAWARDAKAVSLDATAIDIAAVDMSSSGARPVLLEALNPAFDGEGLFHLINMAARPGGGLLITARTLPAAWPVDIPDLRSRLNALPVAEIEPPDDAVLEGVLRRFFRDRNIRPPEAVYPYLLARMGRSIPDARQIVERLDAAGDAGFRPVTRVLARQILEGRLPLEP